MGLNDIVRKAFFYLRTRKFYSISQVLVLHDIVKKAFIFFEEENSQVTATGLEPTTT